MSESEKRLPANRPRRDPAAPIRRRPKRALSDSTDLPTPGGDHDDAYDDFLPVALQVVKAPPSVTRRACAYLICGLVTAGILWAIFGDLRIFAIAPGELQARGGSQVVEPRQPGQVSAVRVKDGDHVAKGAALVELDATAAQASRSIIQAKLNDARAEVVRRRVAASAASAERIDKDIPVTWPVGLPTDVRSREEALLHADLAQLAAIVADLEAELKAKEAARDKYVASIASQKLLIASRTERANMHVILADEGRDSRARVLEALEPVRQEEVTLATFESSLSQAKAAIPVIESQITKARDTFVAENTDKRVIAERLSDDLAQQLIQANLVLADMTLRAPVAGTVHALAVTNPGQAIKVGEKLMQVVPDGSPLEIQAYVLNIDIGFVREGQPAVIKVDTFPYTRYGTIEGRVTHVGADAITGNAAIAQQKDGAATTSGGAQSATGAAQPTSDLVFPVTVVPTKATIRVDGRDVPLTSGMSVVVEIETDRQRGIAYIFYPLTRVWHSRPPAATPAS